MAVNPYFNELTFGPEQGLIDQLQVEAIGIYGWDAHYLPRKYKALDGVLNEDRQSYFDEAPTTTFYLMNTDGFQGQGNILASIGLEIRDQITLRVALTTFHAEIGPLPHPSEAGRTIDRPREGDLVFFPQNQKLFEITFVEKFDVFFQLGKVYTVDLTCQLIEWSGQVFNTGVPQIDALQKLMSENVLDWSLLAEDGVPLLAEDGAFLVVDDYVLDEIDPFDQTDEFEDAAADLFDFDETDPFADGRF